MTDHKDSLATEQITEERLEELVRIYHRPLLICAGKALNRYVSEEDDAWSATLLAFHEAVRNYDEEKGEFWPFASTVIKRRLTDYLRKEYREAGVITIDPAVLSDGPSDADGSRSEADSEVRQRLTQAAVTEGGWPGRYTIADEIEAVQSELESFGFRFYDLTACSPKAEKSRRKCAQAVAALLKDESLMQRLRQKKTLPMAELELKSGVSRKVLDKHRKYLIAAALILDGDYPLLGEYLQPIKEAVNG